MKNALIRLAIVAFCALAAFTFGACGLDLLANADTFADIAGQVRMIGWSLIVLAGLACAAVPFAVFVKVAK
jgi:hypothetical protein